MVNKVDKDMPPPRAAAPLDLSTADVRALATAAGLSLSPDRIAAVLPILNVWLADSAALNTLMQDDAHREVVPITVLRHRASDAGAN